MLPAGQLCAKSSERTDLTPLRFEDPADHLTAVENELACLRSSEVRQTGRHMPLPHRPDRTAEQTGHLDDRERFSLKVRCGAHDAPLTPGQCCGQHCPRRNREKANPCLRLPPVAKRDLRSSARHPLPTPSLPIIAPSSLPQRPPNQPS